MTTQAQVQTLLDSNAAVAERVRAAEALSGAKDPAVQDALIRALDVTHEDVQAAARKSLAKGGGSNRLVAIMKSKERASAERQKAARALRHLQDSATAMALGECLHDADDALRKECAHALAVFGAEQAKEHLVQALGDASAEVRYFAVLALGPMKDPRVRSALSSRAEMETDPTTRAEISRVLGR